MIINFDKILNAISKPIHEPFTHYIVDDVLNSLDINNPNSWHQMIGELTEYKDIITDTYKPYRLFKDIYSGKDLKKIHTDTWARIRLITNKPNIKREAHMDEVSKVWTCIVYCSPEKSDGTVLYKGETKNALCDKKIIEWKPNRGLIFSPGGKGSPTWHRVFNMHNKLRKVVAINIVKSNPKLKFNPWYKNLQLI